MSKAGGKTITIAPVKKTLTVECSQAHAFEVFASGIDRWWPKEHHIGSAPVTKQIIEPRKGGVWRTQHADGSESSNGRVLAWEPPARLVMSWEIGGNWKADTRLEFVSEFEVRFIAESATRTRVEFEHRKFERMPEGGEAMRNGVDSGWPSILDSFRKAAEG